MARMPQIPKEYLDAIAKYGPTVADVAEGYGISGEALLAKTAQGESGFDMGAVSPAGARGGGQFMPGSRDIARSKYGVDPWADPEQAIHAMALHLRGKINGSTGLEGYNPGDPGYPAYILGQKVGDVRGALGRGAGGAPGGGILGESSSSGAPRVSFGSVAGEQQAGGVGLAGMIADRIAQQRPMPAAASAVQAPAFAARAVLAGGGVVPSSGAPQRRSGIAGLIAEAGRLGGEGLPAREETVTVTPGDGPAATAGGPARAARGKVAFAKGTPTNINEPIADFLAGLAGRAGPITVGTTTNHSRFVAGTNRVSEHSVGNAVDIPASGDRLTELGAQALAETGLPWKKALAMAEKGGVFNRPRKGGGRIQIIVNAPGHYDHLHAGVH